MVCGWVNDEVIDATVSNDHDSSFQNSVVDIAAQCFPANFLTTRTPTSVIVYVAVHDLTNLDGVNELASVKLIHSHVLISRIRGAGTRSDKPV